MTFEEAVSLVDRIKEQVIGVPVKGRLIESLFIGPTNWNEMHVFMNICLQKGEDEAIDEFIGKSFSVYSRSVTYINPDLPRWDVIVLDDWEKTIYNWKEVAYLATSFFTGTKGEQLSRFTTISRILGLLLKLRDMFFTISV